MSVHWAVLAVGGNVGNRIANLRDSLKLLASHGIEVLRKSRLYETAPELVTEQPAFMNAAVAVQTKLSPLELLRSCKEVEKSGSTGQRLQWAALWAKAPLADLFDSAELQQCTGLDAQLQTAHRRWQDQGGEAQVGRPGLQAVLPMGTRQEWLWPWKARTQVMAILNLTPDSFSDGGQVVGPAAAVAAARQAVAEGADIVDIGGQSTRPHATRISASEECSRIIPAIRAMAQDEQLKGVPISVDTFQAEVAAAAIAAGAHMVNDVSGGTLDPAMYCQVASLGVPYVLMHMRGDPSTMQQPRHTRYADVAADVGQELQAAAGRAMAAGIEPWSLILDPGIGFAKTLQGNCQLIRDLPVVRQQLQGCLRHQPLLVGPSRKGFLGKLTGREVPAERDVATAAAAALCVQGGANIVRVHSAAIGRDAGQIADGVCKGLSVG